MLRRSFLVASGAFALGCEARRRGASVPGPQRGIAFDGYLAPPSASDFAAMRALGVTHVALFPFGYMRQHTEPRVYRYTDPDTDWSLTDRGLLSTGLMAREAGLSVIVIPTLSDFTDGHWRGEVQMVDEATWDAFFDSYARFLLHYAGLAQEMRAVGLSVGTELRETVAREAEWRRLIGRAREAFNGWITYAANWDDYALVPWWDAVDLIGVQAYFELGEPLGMSRRARRASLVRAWQPIKEELAAFSARTDRRVLFTEVGYKSHTGATVHPWQWEVEGIADPQLQALAYEAAFETFWRERWFAGFYWWKWRARGANDRERDRDFTPQGKPAEAVIRRYYLTG
jgi:hypothetical protein